MTDTVIRKSIYLNARPAKVWAYLTDADKLALWFHRPEAPLTLGQPFECRDAGSGDRVIWGEIRTMRAPEYLEYTFSVKPMGDAVSLVKWTLTPVPGGTNLSLEHHGLPQGSEAFGLTLALDKGWDDHIGRMRDQIHG